MRRSWRRVPAVGVRIAIETTAWGDQPPVPVVGVHATGMCKEVLHPFVSGLAALVPAGEVTTLDQRGHGDTDESDPPYSWWDLGADVLAVIAARGGGPAAPAPVGMGHSSGGAALVLAELLAPGTFSALILVEPIIFPPGADVGEGPLVRAALKRKPVFEDVAAARANFIEKPAFAGWEPAAFDGYLRHGLAPGPGGARLKCRPAAEAEFYRAAPRHGAWARLGEVACPVVLLGGEHSDSHPPDFLEAMAGRFPQPATVDVIAGASHFVMMERPARIAGHVASRVADATATAPAPPPA